ncbi:MAG: hypothetical protein M2R45_02977 [Verrucomicrobia subdivision 3 bacterium]|nr:hypothetical protein [Limisphaerales bacterium]MCS1416536.1 hypothetical protein [Limisphaerales bacterium]
MAAINGRSSLKLQREHSDNGMRRFFVDLHNQGINIVYTNGRAERSDLRVWAQNRYRRIRKELRHQTAIR